MLTAEVYASIFEAAGLRKARRVGDTCFQLLGLPGSATLSDVKDAYWRLAKMYHPDANGGDGERFKTISSAYSQINTDLKLAAYRFELNLNKKTDGVVLFSNGNAILSKTVFAGIAIILGVELWIAGDIPGTSYNGWSVSLGYLLIFLGSGVYANRRYPIRSVLDVFKYIPMAVVGVLRRPFLSIAVVMVACAIDTELNRLFFPFLVK